MTPTTYQAPEIRDSNDNIIKQGSFGKNTALANSTNDGWTDYVVNNLEFLYGLAKDEVVPVSELPSTGDTNKTYLLTTTGVCYRWDGTEWVEISSSEAVSRADSAAYLAEQWATKTSGTVDGTEYSAKYYAEQAQDTADDLSESLEQIATNTANIEENAENIATNTGNIAQNTTDIDIAEKRISNIEKLLQGNLYDYQTDSDSKYVKTVPQGAMPWASLDSVGGKTLVMNQLIYDGNFTAVNSWKVYNKTVADNVLSFYDDTNSYIAVNIGIASNYVNMVAGHKYLICFDAKSSSGKGFIVPSGSTNFGYATWSGATDWTRISTIFVPSTSASVYMGLRFSVTNAGTTETLTCSLKNYQCIDLTLMFGAGNEPTTVAEFTAQFPAPYYAFTQGTLLSAGVTSVISKKADNTTLQNVSIPAEVQALEGYGLSAGSVYNYVDFEAKKFVQNVGSITFDGTQTPVSSTIDTGHCRTIYNVSNVKPYTDTSSIDTEVVSNYLEPSSNSLTNAGEKGILRRANGSSQIIVSLGIASGILNITQFSAYLTAHPLTVYYPLATPIETYISQYLTDDNLISVEAGGTLTFPNSNGDDYRIDVPSAETYMVDLQSAL